MKAPAAKEVKAEDRHQNRRAVKPFKDRNGRALAFRRKNAEMLVEHVIQDLALLSVGDKYRDVGDWFQSE